MKLSAYKITWIEIRPTSGIATKADMKKLGIRVRDVNGCIYNHFATKERAQEWLNNLNGLTLGKKYECRFFSDKQFGMAGFNMQVPFTKKQLNEVTIIG